LPTARAKKQSLQNGATKNFIVPTKTKGVGRKFSSGGATEKRPKISKKYRKIALFSLFQEGPTEKRPKNSKKGHLLYLYHV